MNKKEGASCITTHLLLSKSCVSSFATPDTVAVPAEKPSQSLPSVTVAFQPPGWSVKTLIA